MGIKSTTTLKRASAEAMYRELYRELYEKLYGTKSPIMTNRELGDALDDLREEECRRAGDTCFDNYLVEND